MVLEIFGGLPFFFVCLFYGILHWRFPKLIKNGFLLCILIHGIECLVGIKFFICIDTNHRKKLFHLISIVKITLGGAFRRCLKD